MSSPAEIGVVGLEDAVLAAIIVDDAGQRHAETRQMRAAVRAYGCCWRRRRRSRCRRRSTAAPPRRCVPLLFALDVDRFGANRARLCVVLRYSTKERDAALVVVGRSSRPSSARSSRRDDADALVEEGHLAQARFERCQSGNRRFQRCRAQGLAGPCTSGQKRMVVPVRSVSPMTFRS